MTPQPHVSTRIASLDGLRALAIVFVLLGHLTGTLRYPHILKWLSTGEFGVRIFFVLSGFLITTLLLKELEITRRISLKKFYLRRIFRIFPASYTYILVIFILGLSGVIALHAHDIAHAATYTSNYYDNRSWYAGHLWSLSVEEQFYLLWPLTLFIAGKKRGMVIAGLVCFAVPVIRCSEFAFLHLHVYARFETNADSLAVGCLLAGTTEWLNRRGWYNALMSSRWFVVVPVFTLIFNSSAWQLRYQFTVGDFFMNVGIALCLDWSIRSKAHPVGKVLNWRPVAFVGVLSYSLYLWQQPFLDRNIKSPLTAFPLNILLAVGAALASYYCVERPFLAFKKRFESPSIKRAAATETTPATEPKKARSATASSAR
ncbi:MAG: acyltransferase family protein [Terriglobia bacterium]